MVSYFIERANYWRGEMGWSSAGGYERNTWLWKRNAYTRMFENDFKHRAVQGSIFERVNLSLGKIATFVEQHKSRIVADMLAGEKFFGTSPEGPEDAQEVIEDVERVLQDSAKRQTLLERFNKGDFSDRLRVPRDDPFRSLALSVDQVGRSMERRLRRIEEQSHRERAILETLGEGVVLFDEDQQILKLNQTAARIFDVDLGWALKRRIEEVSRSVALHRLV